MAVLQLMPPSYKTRLRSVSKNWVRIVVCSRGQVLNRDRYGVSSENATLARYVKDPPLNSPSNSSSDFLARARIRVDLANYYQG